MANKHEMDVCKGSLIMAAIEIGKSHCLYSYGFLHEPYTILVKSNVLYLAKDPLAVLFDEKKMFHSFGYAAEDKYAVLSKDDKHFNWYFFKEFMTFWPGQRVTSNLEINDIMGKTMKAVDVFGGIIGFLKDDLQKGIPNVSLLLREDDFSWILTLPDSWPHDTHLIIRDAARKAGIEGKRLSIITESVAALAFYQRMLKPKTIEESDVNSAGGGQENKIVVVNAQNIDTHISVYKQSEDDGLILLQNASNGQCGVASVDEEFYSMLTIIIGSSVKRLLSNCGEENVFDAQRELTITRSCSPRGRKKVTIRVPVSLREQCDHFLKEAIKRSPYDGRFQWNCNKMRMNGEIYENFFKPSADQIVAHLQDIISEQNMEEKCTILLVGELIESPIFQDIIQKALPNRKIIIPSNPRETVCRGAVLFGRKPIPVVANCSKTSVNSGDVTVTEALACTFNCGITPLLFH